MADLKASHMAETGEAVTSIGNLAPPMVVGSITRLALRAEWLVPQRSVDTVTTNVPGPQFPLFCLGREMLEYRPFVPISHGVRVGTAILSYNGRLCFGITGDYTSADDVGVVADATVAEIRRMADEARSHTDEETHDG
jgi:diacylglycerol O-acyltransferase